MKFTEHEFPRSVDELRRLGIAIEYYPSGHLKNVSMINGWTLELEEHLPIGKASCSQAYETYRFGWVSKYDNWSDGEKSYMESWRGWVRKWLVNLCEWSEVKAAHHEQARVAREFAAKDPVRHGLHVVEAEHSQNNPKKDK